MKVNESGLVRSPFHDILPTEGGVSSIKVNRTMEEGSLNIAVLQQAADRRFAQCKSSGQVLLDNDFFC